MSYEQRVIVLLEEGNPATEVHDVGWLETEAAAYLTILTQRSSEVTQLETKPRDNELRRPRGLILGLAAAAVVILVIGMSLLQGGDAPVVDDPVPTTIVDSVQPTVANVTPTTLDVWDSIPVFTGSGNSNVTTRTAIFGVPFSFSGANGWHIVESTEDAFVVEFRPGPTLVHVGALVLPGSVADTVEEVVTAHANYPNATMSEPSGVTVDGALGVLIETTGLPVAGVDVELAAWAGGSDSFSGAKLLGGGRGLLYIVDVNGTTVMVGYDTTPGAFDDYLADAKAIIHSIDWKDLD